MPKVTRCSPSLGLMLSLFLACTHGCGAEGTKNQPEPVVCGGVTCTVSVYIEDYGVTYGPCCDDDNGGVCGAALDDGCEAVDQEGEIDDECPAAVSSIGTTLEGCCRPEGQCGVLSQVGFGCVERTDLNETAGGPLSSIPCTP